MDLSQRELRILASLEIQDSDWGGVGVSGTGRFCNQNPFPDVNADLMSDWR
jgi:hypothetical protein